MMTAVSFQCQISCLFKFDVVGSRRSLSQSFSCHTDVQKRTFLRGASGVTRSRKKKGPQPESAFSLPPGLGYYVITHNYGSVFHDSPKYSLLLALFHRLVERPKSREKKVKLELLFVLSFFLSFFLFFFFFL